MVLQRTLSIIKPDAIFNKKAGMIIDAIYNINLTIVAAKMLWLNQKTAKKLYAIHRAKDFFDPLVQFITSGPILVQVLSGENSIEKYRTLIGATYHPAPNTLRGQFSKSVVENAVHGSDSVENAKYEIALFFSEDEIFDNQ